jgi:glyoxylase-like metal-dependent hydrolase (beta-lactamase superfamily II)
MNVTPFYHPDTFTLTYVVWDADSKDAVVIDPVLDFDPSSGNTHTTSAEAVQEFIEQHGLRTRFILETHAHADHLTGSQFLHKVTEAPIVIGANITKVQEGFKQLLGLGSEFPTDGSQFHRLVRDGEQIDAGSFRVGVIETPGHTPACVSYTIGDGVFTGDALFMDDYGTGRCDFPNGSAADLYHSIHEKLYDLPDETRVFVGHDYQPNGRCLMYETTIGRSKAKNPQLKAETTKDAFVSMRQARDKTLAAPRLLFPSVQINIDAGRLPPPRANGQRYLNQPVNLLRPADAVGKPIDS